MNPILQTSIAVALLAVVALAPLAFALRRGIVLRGRTDADIALHRAQLAELDRELAEGRLGPTEHAAARLELQRRLLAATAAADQAAGTTPTRGDRGLVVVALIVVPVAAIGLYLVGGRPELPDEPHAALVAQAKAETDRDDALVADLHARIAQLDPTSEQARKGWLLLGNLEDNRGRLVAAADAWQHALAIQFDPLLAAEVAEAQTQVEGRVSQRSADLYRRALDAAPKDAPWRAMVEKRLADVK